MLVYQLLVFGALLCVTVAVCVSAVVWFVAYATADLVREAGRG